MGKPGLAIEPGNKPQHHYGADVTRKQYISLIIALCMGTLIEWYDFMIYAQLSNILTKVFFPPTNPATEQLSFWGVYAVGFVARPLGSVIFGHIGDSVGRRITMLASIAAITIPSILIGCLPTYQHIGIAAPILLAILRLIQGVAVGGEFGSAITYLFELAPPEHKGVIASLGQLSIAPGIALGILMVQVVVYACTPEHLMLWGWRVPFLLTLFTAPIAYIMRMHMPEPTEFLQSRQRMVLDRVASTAARKVARAYSRQASRASQGGHAPADLGRRLSSRQVSARLQELSGIAELDVPAGGADDAWAAAEAGKGAAADAKGATHLEPAIPESAPQATRSFLRQLSAKAASVAGAGALGCEGEYAEEVTHLAGKIKHHVPLMVLVRHHWKGVVLQTLMEAEYGGAFYIFFSWIPPYLQNIDGIPMQTTLWALLLAMFTFAACVLATGHFICDRAFRKVWLFMGISTIMGALVVPALLWLDTGTLAALFIAVPGMLGLAGLLGGLFTSIGPQIYPSAVRASGYNLGHNLAMTLFGGVSPLLVTALGESVRPAALAAGVILLIFTGVSWVASVLLVRVVPRVNARATAGEAALLQ